MSSTRMTILAGACVLALPGSAFAQFQLTFPTESGSDDASGWLAGVHAGHNWQRGAMIYGLEADFNWTDLNTDIRKGFDLVAPLPPGVTPPSAHAKASLNWYGTLRGRLGWTNGPVHFYGTGGFAYGRVALSSNFDLNQGPILNFPAIHAHTSSVETGWVLGAGLEYLYAPNVILSLAYQYVDLGDVRIASAGSGGLLSQAAKAEANFHQIRVGLSWKFEPIGKTAVAAAAPWDGWYAGGHVGGARGLDTRADYASDIGGLISDARLKRDITLIGRRDDGLGIYRYRYLWSDTVYAGVMAQEVALLRPDAVVRSAFDDYLRVDYAKLGMKLVTVSQ